MAGWKPTPTPHAHVRAGHHVPYEVRDCTYGKGLFALCDIPAGTLLWKNVAGREGDAGACALRMGTPPMAAAAPPPQCRRRLVRCCCV
jgi:hypothetical protein